MGLVWVELPVSGVCAGPFLCLVAVRRSWFLVLTWDAIFKWHRSLAGMQDNATWVCGDLLFGVDLFWVIKLVPDAVLYQMFQLCRSQHSRILLWKTSCTSPRGGMLTSPMSFRSRHWAPPFRCEWRTPHSVVLGPLVAANTSATSVHGQLQGMPRHPL